MPVGSPLLACRRVTYDRHGDAVIVAEHRYAAHLTALEVEFPCTRTLEPAMAEIVEPFTPLSLVRAAYERYPERLAVIRERLGRPLTYAEKVVFAHADDPATIGLERGVDYGDYRPDRVAMQDATAQMALLQFTLAKLPTVAVPTTVHCDHLIQARVGADTDLKAALDTNSEVYEFLRSVARSTASASGSRAAASSIRSCSRTTRSPAG